ncbi:MAG: hypothetical protein JWQ98_3677 [Chlorobi bacterium]|nr:hypothetical protein [Chlorobiota bacterium]
MKLLLLCLILGVPGFQVAHAQVMGNDTLFTRYFQRDSAGWTAGDATISIPLPDGRTVWLFGDSYLTAVRSSDRTLACLFDVRNAVVIQQGSRFTTINDTSAKGVERTYFKDVPFDNTAVYWPDHGVVQGDTLFVVLDRIMNDASLKFLGNYLAAIHLSEMRLVSIVPLPDFNGIGFGKGLVTDSLSGYCYIYGNKVNWIVFEPYVARFRIGAIRGAWEFFDGKGWSASPVPAAKISSFPVCASFSTVRIGGKYRIISQENGYLTPGLGRHIYAYSSATPYGPFTGERLLYTIEDRYRGEYLVTYNSEAHPQFDDDSLVISYNVNGNDSTCRNNVFTERLDPYCYRPKFIRVPYAMLDSAPVSGADLEPDGRLVTVSPNPARGKVTVDLGGFTGEGIDLALVTMDGRQLLARRFDGLPSHFQTELDLQGVAGDVYLLVIRSKSGVWRRKLVVE